MTTLTRRARIAVGGDARRDAARPLPMARCVSEGAASALVADTDGT